MPHAVLLDVSIPDIDGYEIARQLRADTAFATTLLVAVTGWSGAEREQRAREAGFDEYILKPIRHEVLERLLKG